MIEYEREISMVVDNGKPIVNAHTDRTQVS